MDDEHNHDRPKMDYGPGGSADNPLEINFAREGAAAIVTPVGLIVCQCTGRSHVTLEIGPLEPADLVDAMREVGKPEFQSLMLDHLARMMSEDVL